MASRALTTLLLLATVTLLPTSAYPHCSSRSHTDFARTQTSELDGLILHAARVWDLDPFLLKGLLWVESKFDPGAINARSGARGIAQFTRPAFIELNRMRARRGSSEVFTRELALDPVYAIPASAELLTSLIRRWGPHFGVANYNGGKRRRWFADEVLRQTNRFRSRVKLRPVPWSAFRNVCIPNS